MRAGSKAREIHFQVFLLLFHAADSVRRGRHHLRVAGNRPRAGQRSFGGQSARKGTAHFRRAVRSDRLRPPVTGLLGFVARSTIGAKSQVHPGRVQFASHRASEGPDCPEIVERPQFGGRWPGHEWLAELAALCPSRCYDPRFASEQARDENE